VARLFGYGTLTLPGVLEAVAGVCARGEPALLHGYALVRLAGSSYPGIVPRRHGVVRGVLLHGLDERQLRRIDAYEGPAYERRRVVVRLGGLSTDAWVYVLRETGRGVCRIGTPAEQRRAWLLALAEEGVSPAARFASRRRLR